MTNSGPQKIPVDQVFPLNELLEDLLKEVFSFLDVERLVLLSQTSRRFHILAKNNSVWQEKVDSYLPYLKELFPGRYINDAKNLFIEEIKLVLKSIRTMPIQFVLAALKGKSVETLTDPSGNACPTKVKMSLLSLQLSQGFYHAYDDILKHEECVDEQKNILIQNAIIEATRAGNRKVFDTLVKRFHLKDESFLLSVYNTALASCRAKMYTYIFELYLKDKISESLIIKDLEHHLYHFEFNKNISDNELLHQLEHAFQFKDFEGRPMFLRSTLEKFIKKAAINGSIKIVEYLLSFKDINGKGLFSDDFSREIQKLQTPTSSSVIQNDQEDSKLANNKRIGL